LWQVWKYHNSVSVGMCIMNIQNVYMFFGPPVFICHGSLIHMPFYSSDEN
jgi:hypothetical protein